MQKKVIELISFKLCPFVQRSIITLLKKGVDFKITYIDLVEKPDWFLKISPLGKVPVVKYGDDVLFESAIINEFLDEITEDQIMPTAPLAKAKDRGWIEYSSQIIMDQYRMMTAKNAEAFAQNNDAMRLKLQRLEGVVGSSYFNGEQFSLIDAALAPVLHRLHIIKVKYGQDLLVGLPSLVSLTDSLLSQEYVQRSVVDDFEQLLDEYLKKADSYLVQQVA